MDIIQKIICTDNINVATTLILERILTLAINWFKFDTYVVFNVDFGYVVQ